MRQVAVAALLAESDFVVCLAPANAETENLMNAAAFAAMKPGAFFVNAARGELVDDAALLAALDSGHLGGCALDVGRAPDQMPAPALARHPRVIATPHIGGLTPPAIEHQALETVAQLAQLLRGEMPEGAVNADACRAGGAGATGSATKESAMTTRAAPPARAPATATCTSTKTRYPLAPTATFKPPHAPAVGYRAVQRELGLAARRRRPADRLRLRQPLHARPRWPRSGPRRAASSSSRRTSPTPSSRACTRAGVRGVRFMMLPGGVLPWSALEPMAARDRAARLAHRPAARRPRAAAARGDAARACRAAS